MINHKHKKYNYLFLRFKLFILFKRDWCININNNIKTRVLAT